MSKRIGSGGRPPMGSPPQDLSERVNISFPHSLHERLNKYAEDDERSKSWVVQKAVDKWLTEKWY